MSWKNYYRAMIGFAIITLAVTIFIDCSNESGRPSGGRDSQSRNSERAGRDAVRSGRNGAGRTRDAVWLAPDTGRMALTDEGRLAAYDRELIMHTSVYLGPKGRIASVSNGMNCQNCHLDAGSKPWGNNYGAVFSTYPKFRDRSGTIENIYRRVNDCLERSLGGVALDTNSREMKAIYTYMKWLGSGVPRGVHPIGAGIREIPFMDRAADPAKGQLVYEQK
ncbi:MAG TPA: hypothetical protein VNU72_11530, partial [Puia sp.]|nr:hypothetical protein [Puia sp.]